MPTFLVFKGGKEVKRIQGADAKALEAAVKAAVADVSSFGGEGRTLGDAPVPAPAVAAGGAGTGAGKGAASGKAVYMRNGQAMSRFVLNCRECRQCG